MDYTIEHGRELIQFARKNIIHFLQTGERLEIPPEMAKKYQDRGGAFVTLNKLEAKKDFSLRGCIGIILPIFPLIETIQNVSVSSAVEDPRFPNVKLEEMEKIVIEISILSVPERIIVKKPEDYLKEIVIGRDGLIINHSGRKGLLLPQVPVEHDRHWDSKTFLEHTCKKAWLPIDAWKDIENTTVERFTATIFEEIAPGGEIRPKKIGE